MTTATDPISQFITDTSQFITDFLNMLLPFLFDFLRQMLAALVF